MVDHWDLEHVSVLTWEKCGVADQVDLHISGNGTDRERHGSVCVCVSLDAQESVVVRICLLVVGS